MKKSDDYEKLIKKESLMKLDEKNTYIQFKERIMNMRNKVVDAINKAGNKGEVFGLGASTKGNMLLQTFGLTKEEIPYISERNPDKVGLRTLGTDIELISEDDARNRAPKMMLVLPWYFKDEIVKREYDYLKDGGKLLIPMPYPHIVDIHGEIEL